MGKVLVLNASYEPLNITSWRRAVVLLLKGKAEQLEHNGQFIYRDFPIPTVIRLRYFVKVPYKEIPLTRRNLLERDRQTCQYCNYRGEELTLDHVMPRSRGGGDTWENLVAACVRCNVKKGNRTP
ncbi:MAG: HNH endonuclease, partial [Microcystaceae cyanobacterium]